MASNNEHNLNGLYLPTRSEDWEINELFSEITSTIQPTTFTDEAVNTTLKTIHERLKAVEAALKKVEDLAETHSKRINILRDTLRKILNSRRSRK